ncbi:MAG: SAM hydrolase/SAM-dependent halogenase family protein [Candidatus Hodarchaeales archaeon]|jgi:S-adenosylmethionine hydrolase
MKPQNCPLILIITDFGHDPYSAIMKGKILQINPMVKILTLTNHIQNHNIRQAAFILLKSYKFFPPYTIFLAVVDPGVGGSRRAIGAQIDPYFFVGPDNGIFSPILSENKENIIVELPIPIEASYTFHGRDVFAPAAGKLSKILAIEELGPPSNIQTPLRFQWDPETITGEVIFIDHFGNIITNLPSSINLNYDKEYSLLVNDTEISLFLKRSYYEGEKDKPILIINSFQTLEIALRNGKAADILDINPSDRIQIQNLER